MTMVSLDVSSHMDLIGSGNRHIFFTSDVENGSQSSGIRPEVPYRQVSGIRLTSTPISSKHTKEDWNLSVAFMKRGSVAVFVALLLGSFHEMAHALLLVGAAHGAVSTANNLRGKTLKMEMEHRYLGESLKKIDFELENAMKGLETIQKQLRTGAAARNTVELELENAMEDLETVSKHLRSGNAVRDELAENNEAERLVKKLRAGNGTPGTVLP